MYRHLTRNSSSDGQSLVMRFEICCAAGVMSWFIAAGGSDELAQSELGF
jgi:hypothetical protein